MSLCRVILIIKPIGNYELLVARSKRSKSQSKKLGGFNKKKLIFCLAAKALKNSNNLCSRNDVSEETNKNISLRTVAEKEGNQIIICNKILSLNWSTYMSKSILSLNLCTLVKCQLNPFRGREKGLRCYIELRVFIVSVEPSSQVFWSVLPLRIFALKSQTKQLWSLILVNKIRTFCFTF